MNARINTLVSSALDSATAFTKAVEGIRTALKGHMSHVEVRAALLVPVASYYRVKLVAKERGEGVTWDTEAKNYETAKKQHQRLVASVMGKTDSSTDAIEIPEEMLVAARKLVKLAGQYEHASKLVATALAQVRAE